MRITIKGKRLNLNDDDVKYAKKSVKMFTETVRKNTLEKGVPSLYFTVLIVMQIVSQQLLDDYEPEDLEEIINLTNAARADARKNN